MAHWIEQAVLYSIDVPSFRDADGDGTGDIRGIITSLDGLAEMGVTALWILPFYVSPRRDNGYDVANHYEVDPRLGTLDDFRQLVDEARRRDIRIVIDLVVNHTSDQHPWFQDILSDPSSPYRDHYVWIQDPRPLPNRDPVFPGFEDSIWAFCEGPDSFYLHQFHHFEPDLNHEHPAVREEMRNIIRYWLDIGVDGFRVDAAPFLGDDPAASHLDPHELLRHIRMWITEANPDAVFIAEADLPTEELPAYFGDHEDEVQALFDFYLNRHFFLALAEGAAAPFKRALAAAPPPPPGCALLSFLRNADELSMSWLTDEEKAAMLDAFAPDPAMRIFVRGIRRRLAPLLDNDLRKLEFIFSLQFSLPATPVIVYGDEIGLGENLTLPERHSSRVAMPWDLTDNVPDPTPSRLLLPGITAREAAAIPVPPTPPFAHATRLRNWVRQLIALRRSLGPMRYRDFQVIDCDAPGLLVHCCDLEEGTLAYVHNFSSVPQAIDLGAMMAGGEVILGSGDLTPGDTAPDMLTIEGYGYLWLRTANVAASRPDRVSEVVAI